MINKTQLIEKLCSFADTQLNSIATTNPVISVFKPVIRRVISNKLLEADNFFSLLTDDTGNIDAKGIIGEMVDSITNTNPFNIEVPVVGTITIGGGTVKMGIPFTGKSIVFNEKDFNELKEILNG